MTFRPDLELLASRAFDTLYFFAFICMSVTETDTSATSVFMRSSNLQAGLQ